MGRRSRALACLGAVVALVVGAGCSSTDDGAARREPTGQETRQRVRSQLDGVPKYPRSELLQADIADGAQTFVATYSVASATPQQVSDYLVQTLEQRGWSNELGPEQSGDSFRSEWLAPSADRTLLVSTGPAPTVERGGGDPRDVVSQYSLTLQVDAERDAPPPPD